MAKAPAVNVMISSRCRDKIEFEGKEVNLSVVRQRLKERIEVEKLCGEDLFNVWISEDPAAPDFTVDSWDLCLDQVRKADIVIVLFNGNSGGTTLGGTIGICHAEYHEAYSSAPGKIRMINLPMAEKQTGQAAVRDETFRNHIRDHGRFYAHAETGEDVIRECKRALREAVAVMVHLGVREARRGKYHTGTALEWSRLDHTTRQAAMVKQGLNALAAHTKSERLDNGVFVSVADKRVLFCCHAVPDALTVPSAREMIGRPFLRDHQKAQHLKGKRVGPVHIILCQQGVTEAQARSMLGFPDATIVSAPFGIYVADDVQKIQLLFVRNCRDRDLTGHGIQRVFEWLRQTGEDVLLCQRATQRAKVVRVISDVANT